MIILKSVVSRNTLELKSKDNRLLLTVYGRHSAILVICNIETQGLCCKRNIYKQYSLLVKGIHFCSLPSITVFLGFSILILKMKELTNSKVSCKWIELPC